jgi:hypothetical protein
LTVITPIRRFEAAHLPRLCSGLFDFSGYDLGGVHAQADEAHSHSCEQGFHDHGDFSCFDCYELELVQTRHYHEVIEFSSPIKPALTGLRPCPECVRELRNALRFPPPTCA